MIQYVADFSVPYQRMKLNMQKYLNLTQEEGYNWGFIRGVWNSISDVSIALMQDFLNLGNETRMNMSSTIDNN